MKNKTNIKSAGLVSIILLVLALGYIFLKQAGYTLFIQWYVTLLLITISALPITVKLFKNFRDGGYIFAKCIGIAFSGFIMWLLSFTHILQFNIINAYICVGIVLVLSIAIILNDKRKESTETIDYIKEKLPTFLKIELAFLIILIGACYIKSFKPEAYGLEKFMDFGFMKIMDQTAYMPPEDMWFSGNPINYYYMGQYLSTFVSKLSNVAVEYGYNFMLATIFTLAVCGVYSIVYNLLNVAVGDKKEKKKIYKVIPVIGAIISTVAVNIAGNMHYVIYGLLSPIFKWETGTYRFWDSTRFIGYNPETDDKTIHEFPNYSYIVGDLHAHVIDIMFVIVGIALLFAFLLKNKDKIKEKIKLSEIVQPVIIVFGIFIGLFKTINFWDYPIYTVVGFLVFLFSNLQNYKKKRYAILATILQVVTVFVTSYIISTPFMLKFQKMSSAIKFTHSHTPIWQLLVLWGLPTITVLYFFIVTMCKRLEKDGKKIWLIRYIENLSITDAFIIILGCSAIGLVIAPELVYVKDIYTTSQYRANTMFKLTYQSFIMFGTCFGYIIMQLLFIKNKIINIIAGFIVGIPLLLTSYYGVAFTFEWFGNINDISKERTLDCSEFLENTIIKSGVTSKDDLNIINWVKENIKENPVILEEQGKDFTYSNRISTFTGKPTVIGWRDHEWLWRSVNSSTEMPESVKTRMASVKAMYTSTDTDFLKSIIKAYDIGYIVVGYNERQNYATSESKDKLDNEEQIKSLGEIVYETNENNLQEPTYILKINEELRHSNAE